MQGEAQAQGQHQGDAEGPLKSLWTPRLLVILEGKPLEKILTYPGQAEWVNQVVAHLLEEFHLLI